MSRVRSRFTWLTPVCCSPSPSPPPTRRALPTSKSRRPAPSQFSVLWRTPVLAGMRLPVVLKLPDDVKNLREPSVQELADSFVERRWIDAGPNGLAGKRIEFPGLQFTITDVLRARGNARRQKVDLHHPSVAALG